MAADSDSLFAYALERQRGRDRARLSAQASLRLTLTVTDERQHPDFMDRAVQGQRNGQRVPLVIERCAMLDYPESAPRPGSVTAPAEVVVMAWQCAGAGPFAYPLTMN